jgi:hypothetical protein
MIPPNEFRNAENFRFRGGSVVSRGVLLRLPPETCHRTMRTLSVLHEAAKVIVILSALLGAASLVMGQDRAPDPGPPRAGAFPEHTGGQQMRAGGYMPWAGTGLDAGQNRIVTPAPAVPEPARDKAAGLNPWPLALYGVGGAADVWSTRSTPVGYHRVDRSFAGPVAGPVLTAAAFAGADSLLQVTHHKGWAWAVRGLYAVGDAIVVISNKRKR